MSVLNNSLFRIFRDVVYCLIIKVLCRCFFLRQRSYLNISSIACQQLFKIYFSLFRSTHLSHATALLDYHTFSSLSTLFPKFIQIFFDVISNQRRKRDLNPRAATNDLLPFQGSPFSLLGISPTDLLP